MTFLLICALIFVLFGLSTFTAHENLLSAIILMFAFCLASTAFIYLVEKAFSEPSMGQLVVLCSTTLIGLMTLVVTLILQLLWWIPVSVQLMISHSEKTIFCVSGGPRSFLNFKQSFPRFPSLCSWRRPFGVDNEPGD